MLDQAVVEMQVCLLKAPPLVLHVRTALLHGLHVQTAHPLIPDVQATLQLKRKCIQHLACCCPESGSSLI